MPAARRLLRRRARNRGPRPRFFADRSNPLETMSGEEIFSRYRFRPDTILFITSIIMEPLQRTKRNKALTPLQSVLTCLRFLATGCFYREVADLMGMDACTVGRTIHLVCFLLFQVRKRFINFPTGPEALRTKAAFASLAGFPKVLGCIDCTHVKIQRPTEHEEDFVNRKGYHSLNIQAICDAKYRFTSIRGNMPGSVHDSRIWKLSALRQQFETGIHDGFLIGDSGYPCRRYLMTPFLSPNTQPEQRFNKSLCRTRVTIEQTFGIWKQRFACLQRGIRSHPARVVHIAAACAVLHNIGIDRHDIVDFDYMFPQDLSLINETYATPPCRDGIATRQVLVNNFFV